MQKKKQPLIKTEKKDNKKKSENTLGSPKIILLLPALLPLFFSEKTVDVTIPTRYLFLSGFILLYILVFYVLIEKNQARKNPPPIIQLAYALNLGFALCMIASVHNAANYRTVYFETGKHLLFLLTLFLLVQHFLDSTKSILDFCKVLLVVSLIQSTIGLFQLYGLGFTNIPGHSIPYGISANGNLFGSAQMLLLPFTLFVFFKADKFWKTLSIVAVTGILASIISSKTRAAWLGTTFSLVISTILIAILIPDERKKWLKTISIIVVTVPIIVGVLITTTANNKFAEAIKDRTTNISLDVTKSQGAKTINDRLTIWKKTYLLIKDNPWLGVGIGNWPMTITNYGTEGTAWEAVKYVPDKVHNVYLEIVSETGIIGASFYFGFFVLMILIAIKNITTTPETSQKILSVFMLAVLLSFAVDCIFSFANHRIEHMLYITITLAIIMTIHIQHTSTLNKSGILNTRAVYLFLALIPATNIFLAFKKYQFEVHLNRIRAYEKKQNYSKVIEEGELGKNRVITLDGVGTSIESHTASAHKNLKNFPLALKEIRWAEKYNPGNSKVYNTMGTIFTEMGNYDSAVICYRKALQITPKFEAALKNLSMNYFQLKNYSGCIKTISLFEIGNDKIFHDIKNECERQLKLQTKQ